MSTALPTLATVAGFSPCVAGSTRVESRWCLQRNCSMTPSALLTLYAGLAAVSLAIGAFFWSHGAPLVLPFAVVEILAVGVALLVYARHAVDGERVRLEHDRLIVERRRGAREERFEFDVHWVRVSALPGGALDVCEGRRSLRVGAFAAPVRRAQALREINEALAQVRRTSAAGGQSG